ncbi:hypothetical protein LSCM4_06332 [Leishmania orientalis]|uniref:Uncharacterized protein n=1 Tax=Leishmania orientalis TaxID=2249476 RepID=A0A836HYU4_9TRYP|nr:hypothetical protein LSCM4_06332 [Leishmania orientalis]
MESASDGFHHQIRRIQAQLRRLGWHQHTGDRVALPRTPVASLASARDPLDGSPMTTIQSALEAADGCAEGVATEALPTPKSVARAPSSSALPAVLGEHDANRVTSKGCKSRFTSPLTASGAVDGFECVGLQPSHQHHGNTARVAALPTHCSAGGTSRAAEPHMFVRYVCDGEHDSTQATAGVPAHPSSVSRPFSSAGSVTVTDAFDDIIARAWGRAEMPPVDGVRDLNGRRIATASLHTRGSRQWSREGCPVSPDAAAPLMGKVRHPVAFSRRAASSSTASVPVSSFLSFTALQPPTATQHHDSGRPFSHRAQRVRAPATRIASPVGTGAVYRSSMHADRSTDALCARGRKTATSSCAPPPAPTPKRAVDALQRQQRLLRAIQLVDAALQGSSGGSSEEVYAKKLARLHPILATLTDARGQSLGLPSRVSAAELRRFRKRLLQQLLLGNPAPGVLRRASASSRMPSRPSAPSAPQVTIQGDFEADDEADAGRRCAARLPDTAGDVQLANPSSSPAPVISPLCFATAHSNIPARTAATSAPPELPLSPPSPSASDPYTASQQRFQLEMASLHQAQQRRLQLQRQRADAI